MFVEAFWVTIAHHPVAALVQEVPAQVKVIEVYPAFNKAKQGPLNPELPAQSAATVLGEVVLVVKLV